MSIASRTCPKCGSPISPEAPQGLCPKCLLVEVSNPTEGGKSRPINPPSLEELSRAFPQLEVVELIGHGGMGFVFKARQPKLDRFVALKILPQSLAADPAFAERFSREGRVLARLNHPNIVTVHDFGQANGFFYLLMEFVDGVNLRQGMGAGRFTAAQALAIVPKICDALQYAHNEGVLHRDIKPENILLDTRGRVKIADFGIAKIFGAPVAEETLTGTGATLGTPHYMAPEQIENPTEVDHRADIYSLGVVFYELLTGELPLGRFKPPSEKTTVDARVDDIVFRALQKERELRQQSATEVRTAVETVASTAGAARGGTVRMPTAPAGNASEQTPNPWPRRLFFLMAAIILLPAGSVILYLLVPSFQSKRAPDAAPGIESLAGSNIAGSIPRTTATTASTKVIVFTKPYNTVGNTNGARTVTARTDTLLLPGESINVVTKLVDGRFAEGYGSFFTMRGAQSVKTSTYLSWFIPESFSDDLMNDAVEQMRRATADRPLTLVEDERMPMFSITNGTGAVLAGFAVLRKASPELTGDAKPYALIRLLPQRSFLSLSAEVPAGYSLEATAHTPVLGEATAHTSKFRTEYLCNWHSLGTFAHNFRDSQAQVEQLAERGPLKVYFGERLILFSITNKNGDVFKGALELFGPPKVDAP